MSTVVVAFVLQRIDIDLPRPRSLTLKRNPAFVKYLDQVWTLIEEEGRIGAGSGRRLEPASTQPPAASGRADEPGTMPARRQLCNSIRIRSSDR